MSARCQPHLPLARGAEVRSVRRRERRQGNVKKEEGRDERRGNRTDRMESAEIGKESGRDKEGSEKSGDQRSTK